MRPGAPRLVVARVGALSTHILIVSEDAELGQLARRAFARRDPKIDLRSGAREALRAAEAGVDIVIIDLDLPRLPARALLARLARCAPPALFLVSGTRGIARAIELAREQGYEIVARPLEAARLRRAANLSTKRAQAEKEGRAFIDRLDDSSRLLAVTQSRLRRKILAQNHELLSLQELSERIFQVLGSGLLLLDADAQLTRLNAAAEAMLGWSESEAKGRPAAEIFRTAESTLLTDAVGGEKPPFDDEVLVTTRGGSEVPVLLRTSPLRDEAGGPAGLVVNFSDLTRVKQQNREIRRIERLASLGELSAGMAHEIRNPLAGIEMTAELLAKRLSPDDPSRSLITIIVDEVRRLNRLIEDLLRFARPARPQFSPQGIPVIMERCLTLLARKAKEKSLVLRRRFPPDIPLVDLDAAQMTQVFLNLLKNAIEATPPLGTVSIVATLSPGGDSESEEAAVPTMVRIEIEDSGAGIAPEILENIWNPFFSTKPNGTGLGLPICQRIVAEHRGRISIVPAGGQGTRVVVELPVPLYGARELPPQEAIKRLSDIYG